MALYTALVSAVDAVAANFVTLQVPLYILMFSVVFIIVAKLLTGMDTHMALMVYLLAASGAYLLMTMSYVPTIAVTASDVAIGIGFILTGYVLIRVGAAVGFLG